MTISKKKLSLLTFLFIGIIQAQHLSIDTNTYTVPELINDVLIDNSCTIISNITWSTGTNHASVNGIGYFENNNPDFPFSSGIVLSTGNVTESPGPNDDSLAGGNNNWPGDQDLFNYIDNLGIDNGLINYFNATIIEFDFLPLTDSFSFRFLFSSDEYGTYQCDFSDAFAFFLTNTQTNTTTNLATIPNTTTPISVVTIRDQAYNQNCSSQNEQYFGNFNGGIDASASASNYNGETTVLTAGSTVTPHTLYHIKLVIADRNDYKLDSAVFLEAGSFSTDNLTVTYELEDGTPSDQNAVFCNESEKLLHSGYNAQYFDFVWKLNGQPINGATSASFLATQSGEYCCEAISKESSECVLSDCITIEFSLSDATIDAPDSICLGDNAIFTVQGSPNSTISYNLNGGVNQTITLDNSGTSTITMNNPLNDVTLTLTQINFSNCTKDINTSKTIQVIEMPMINSIISNGPVCPLEDAKFIINGSASAQILYRINNGTSQTANLNSSGELQLSVPSVTTTTTLNIDQISIGSCLENIGESEVVNIYPTGTISSITSNSPICQGEDAIYLFEGTPNATIGYTLDSGSYQTITLDSGGQGSILITDVQNNLNLSVVDIDNGNCKVDWDNNYPIEVIELPQIINLSSNSPICEGEDIVFQINGTQNSIVSYTMENTSYTVALNNSGEAIVTITNASNDTTLTIDSISNNICTKPIGNLSESVVVNAIPFIDSISNNGPICYQETAIFSIEGSSNSTIKYQLNSGTLNNLTLDNQGNGTISVNNATENITILITNIDNNFCSFNPEINQTIIVNPLPTLNLKDGELCVESLSGEVFQTHTLDTNLDSNTYDFKWYHEGQIIQNANSSSYLADQLGTYTVEITNRQTTCLSTDSAIIKAIYPADELKVVATDAFTENPKITATVIGGNGSYLYQLDDGSLQPSNQWHYVTPGTHRVTVVDQTGCTYLTKEVIVIDYPKFFTPNGDNYNEFWNIIGLDFQPNAKIYIFDRYGRFIKQLSSTEAGWDGTYKGHDLPSSDYWFSVQYIEDEEEKIFKAHFALKR